MVNMNVLVTINLVMAAYCLPSVPSCRNYCRTLSSGVTVTWRPECNCMAQGNTEIGSEYSPHIFSWHSTIEGRGKSFPESLISTPKTNNLPPTIYEDVKIFETSRTPKTAEIEKSPIQYTQFDQANEEINLNNVKLREQDLAECIELYILKSSRNCNTTADPADFKYNNLEDYIDIPDDELAQEIENKCKEVNHIIESSLKEIRGKWWSKIKQNTKNYQLHTLANKEIKQKTIFDGYSYNVPPDPVHKDSTNTITIKENGKQAIPNTENGEWLLPSNHGFPEFGIETLTNPPTPENKVIAEPITKYVSNNEKPIPPTTTPYIHYDGNQHTSRPVHYQTVTDAIEPSFDINTPTEHIKLEQHVLNSLDDTYINNADKGPYQLEPNSIASENTAATLQDIKNDKVYLLEQTINEGKPEDYTNEIKNNKRRLYEADKSVAKIVSREYPNGTVSSKIQGTELYSDNEFTVNNPSILITKLEKNNTKNNKHHEVNSKENQKISGQLYFVHDGKQVPTRFIQELDGNIRLGLDALTICEHICRCSCTNDNN